MHNKGKGELEELGRVQNTQDVSPGMWETCKGVSGV